MDREIYQEPLVSRYTSREMQELFSERTRIRTWRRCWIALAEAQNELGLDEIVTRDMIDELKEHADDIDFDLAAAKEKEVIQDVLIYEIIILLSAANSKNIYEILKMSHNIYYVKLTIYL